jgi:UDP-N-acetylglucosamine--N-acetylmuramyl-(pentapeptide) pyrophosphoryl-undecaprenol N-acetylglucosamine transferase
VTGLPVREEFFRISPRADTGTLRVLITGGSGGARTLNRAARESWALFRSAGFPVYLLHQTGRDSFEETRAAFAESGLEGEVVPFIDDMAAAFASSDVIVSRAGAGALSEIAAAGKASVLVPYPYAADQHQMRNAESFARAGAAKLALDKELTGERLFRAVLEAAAERRTMGEAARKFARPGAAERAADLLEEFIDRRPEVRNNTRR